MIARMGADMVTRHGVRLSALFAQPHDNAAGAIKTLRL
jgi:hypothetical protein